MLKFIISTYFIIIIKLQNKYVGGMKCKHCKQNLNDALTEDIKGVDVLEISIEEGYALVDINEDVHIDDIKNIVEDLGFKLIDVK